MRPALQVTTKLQTKFSTIYMDSFLVTFSIQKDENFQMRHRSLVDAIKGIADTEPWEETATLYIFQASGTAAAICNSLYTNSKLTRNDKIVVINLDSKMHDYRNIEYPRKLRSTIG